ncbi:MAG: hypothetical protein CVV37_01195 [Nitrospira bacterium HGW-Nitrospira-1]|nr:MAG: hypothetical protein CVV37_01195 [Nitrospira bacterium HGW-Nitrospira-1]
MTKKYFLVAGAVLLISLSACAKSIRYSQEEIKNFSPTIQERIKNKEIAVGMTKLQVRYAWGGPDNVIVLPPSENGKERIEWVYEKLHFFKSRLIFTDDKLTEIISTEPGITK